MCVAQSVERTKKEDTHMCLGFKNMDKKTLNSYTKKSEKKAEMKKRLTCQHFGMPHLYTENTLGYYYVSLW